MRIQTLKGEGKFMSRNEKTIHKRENKKIKKFSKKKIMSIILLLIFLSAGVFNIVIRIASYKKVVGFAIWKTTNGQRYLDVEADNSYDLGYLTGGKLATKIISLKITLMFLASSFDTSYLDLNKRAQKYIPFIPTDQIDEMKGMSAGSSNKLGFPITFNDILIQNTFIDIFYGQILPKNPDLLGCTTIAAKNANGVEFGQNFDFLKIFKDSTSFVLHKQGNQPAIFSVRFGGVLDYPIGKNSNNVSIMSSVVATLLSSQPTIPISCRTRIAFENATSAESFKNIFFDELGANFSCGQTLTMMDNNIIYTSEINPNSYVLNQTNSSVKSNTFSVPSWQQYLVRPNYSKDRQSLAEAQFEEKYNDNNLSFKELREILSLPGIIQDGSDSSNIITLAFFTSNGFGLGNINSSIGILPI